MYAPVRATPLRTPDNGEMPDDWRGITPQQQADNVLGWAKLKTPRLIQIGGDETVGRGLVRLTWLP
jgi:CRISPR/Cas system CMR subunit Cmr4 (Cas7 group RAMP superfamily)